MVPSNTTRDAYKIEMIRQDSPSLVKTWVDLQNDHEALLLAGALTGNSHLRVLRLHFMETEGHEVTEATVQELASAITQSNLEGLVLAWRFFQSRHGSLARNLLAAVAHSPTIRDLNLLHGGDVIALTTCLPRLRKLCIVDSRSQPSHLHPLFQHLYTTSTLQTIAIQGIQFDTVDMQLLSKGLAEQSSVTRLVLDRCRIRDDGVEAFLRSWPVDSPLRDLEWTNNLITAVGASQLIKAASRRDAMEILNMNQNEELGYAGLACISLELPHLMLKKLKVASCVPRSLHGLADSVEASQLIAQLVLQGMDANSHLLDLDITGNGIDTVAQKFQRKFQFFTFRNRHLPHMSPFTSTQLGSFELPPSTWCHVLANYTHNPSCIMLFLKEQPILMLQASLPVGAVDNNRDNDDASVGGNHRKRQRATMS